MRVDSLKPQDLLVALKIVSLGSDRLTYAKLGQSLGMSQSEVHAAVKRLRNSRIVSEDGSVLRLCLMEFISHGVRYVYPAIEGGSSSGLPTGYSGPAMNGRLTYSAPVVWENKGSKRDKRHVDGVSIEPIYKTAPFAARQDLKLYKLLSLVDVFRMGVARESEIARELLKTELYE